MSTSNPVGAKRLKYACSAKSVGSSTMACTSRRISDLWATSRPGALTASARRMLGPAPGTSACAYHRERRSAGPLYLSAASVALSTSRVYCRADLAVPPSLFSRRHLSIMQNGTANGHNVVRPLTPGIYAPIPTFYQPETEDLGASSCPSRVP